MLRNYVTRGKRNGLCAFLRNLLPWKLPSASRGAVMCNPMDWQSRSRGQGKEKQQREEEGRHTVAAQAFDRRHVRARPPSAVLTGTPDAAGQRGADSGMCAHCTMSTGPEPRVLGDCVLCIITSQHDLPFQL